MFTLDSAIVHIQVKNISSETGSHFMQRENINLYLPSVIALYFYLLYVIRAPDNLHILNSKIPISLPNSMYEHFETILTSGQT